MSIEGKLIIKLRTSGERVDQVSIDSSRPVHASRAFRGKDVSEALQMVPMLFNICGTAQLCACVRACEQALGYKPAAVKEQLRECLVQVETAREHLWRILLDWPGFIGEAPRRNEVGEVLALQREYKRELTANYDPFGLTEGDQGMVPELPDNLQDRLDSILEQMVYGISPTAWLQISSPQALHQWANTNHTIGARLLNQVAQSGWTELGNCEVSGLPLMDTEKLDQLMQITAFVEQPQWLDVCRETTCLTRVDSRLMRELKGQYGNGLLVRLAARLTELAQISRKLMPEAEPNLPQEHHNPGMGRANAARGHLIHRVHIVEQKIASFQILAPTEWNFHPGGVVAKSLATLEGDKTQLAQQAHLLINAIDPCVSYELGII